MIPSIQEVLATTCARVPVAITAPLIASNPNARPINSASIFVMTGAKSPIFGQIVELIQLHKEQVRKSWNIKLIITSITSTHALAKDVANAHHEIMSHNLRTKRYSNKIEM